MKILKNNDNYDIVINEILKELSKYDNFSELEKKVRLILNAIKFDIEKVKIDENEMIIYIYDGNFYAINYDFKNYPLFSFFIDYIKFDSYGIENIVINDNITFNLFEVNIENFVKIK